MTHWLLLAAGGLLGSAHCVGMCGGFAVALGTGPSFPANLRRQLAYGLGRVFTYGVGGAVAGFAGWRLGAQTRGLVNAQAILCLAAELVLVVVGLREAGVFDALLEWASARRAGRATRVALPLAHEPGPVCGMFSDLLRSTRLRSAFLGGVINGLLPCGLVYAYLALAAGSGDMLQGALTMLCFGLGTLPLLATIGCGGSLLSAGRRKAILRAAACCVVLTGAGTLARGEFPPNSRRAELPLLPALVRGP